MPPKCRNGLIQLSDAAQYIDAIWCIHPEFYGSSKSPPTYEFVIMFGLPALLLVFSNLFSSTSYVLDWLPRRVISSGASSTEPNNRAEALRVDPYFWPIPPCNCRPINSIYMLVYPYVAHIYHMQLESAFANICKHTLKASWYNLSSKLRGPHITRMVRLRLLVHLCCS